MSVEIVFRRRLLLWDLLPHYQTKKKDKLSRRRVERVDGVLQAAISLLRLDGHQLQSCDLPTSRMLANIQVD